MEEGGGVLGLLYGNSDSFKGKIMSSIRCLSGLVSAAPILYIQAFGAAVWKEAKDTAEDEAYLRKGKEEKQRRLQQQLQKEKYDFEKQDLEGKVKKIRISPKKHGESGRQ